MAAPNASDPPLRVDKDVALAKEHFGIESDYLDMSPIVIERGATKDFLDGKRLEWQDASIANTIRRSFERISAENDFVVVEGTGHCGVGSILGWNNARVAATLGVDVILVANGGLGSTFDELALNRMACQVEGANIGGIIVNKVNQGQEAPTRKYLEKAIERFKWDVPLLGTVPYGDALDQPSALDLETLFGTKLIGGWQHRLRRFEHYELVTTSLRRFMDKLAKEEKLRPCKISKTCFVTHASRNDIILGLLSHVSKHDDLAAPWSSERKQPFEGGLILTGSPPSNTPATFCADYISHANCPILCVPVSTSKTMEAIKSYTPKLSAADSERTMKVIDQYAPHIDVARILQETASPASAAV